MLGDGTLGSAEIFRPGQKRVRRNARSLQMNLFFCPLSHILQQSFAYGCSFGRQVSHSEVDFNSVSGIH